MKPLVSIVIPTYNRSEFLREAVISAVLQDYRPLEIIVVDDGSTDDTKTVLSEMEETIKDEGISFIPISKSTNHGCGKCLDIGFSNAKGEYISYLADDDLFITRSKTARQVSQMDLQRADWSYFRDMKSGTDPNRSVLIQPSFVPGTRIFDKVFNNPRLRFLMLLWRNPINSSSMMVRREVYEEHGGWESWTENADCDGFLFMNYSLLGLKGIAIDGAPVFYREHLGQVSKRNTMRPGRTATRCTMLQAVRTGEYPLWLKAASRVMEVMI